MITAKQATKACILCQDLSRGYKSINLFRYDPKEKYIFILAGETIEIKLKMATGDLLMSENLKKMTRSELRAYMLQHRNDDEKIRAAIAESSSRPGWTEVPADLPLEEQREIFKKAIQIE